MSKVTLPYRMKHGLNVLSAFVRGNISASSCLKGLRHPGETTMLAYKRPGTGMLIVCPVLQSTSMGD